MEPRARRFLLIWALSFASSTGLGLSYVSIWVWEFFAWFGADGDDFVLRLGWIAGIMGILAFYWRKEAMRSVRAELAANEKAPQEQPVVKNLHGVAIAVIASTCLALAGLFFYTGSLVFASRPVWAMHLAFAGTLSSLCLSMLLKGMIDAERDQAGEPTTG
jgi:hypothetical protein